MDGWVGGWKVEATTYRAGVHGRRTFLDGEGSRARDGDIWRTGAALRRNGGDESKDSRGEVRATHDL